ncbi:unnamed protein product [Bubo scandiacus]
MCTTLGKRRVESTLTENRHAQTSEGKLPGQLKIPEFNQVKVRDIVTQQVHPDHDHENKGCGFSTNTDQNTMFFSSHHLQRSSEDAMNAIA